MPARAMKVCARCSNLTRERLCDACKGTAARADQATRGTAAHRGYGARHRRWRKAILARDPVCRNPFKRHDGVLVPSTVADHIVPLTKSGTWELSNGQGLCNACHNYKTALDSGRAVGGSRSLPANAPGPAGASDSLLYGMGTGTRTRTAGGR